MDGRFLASTIVLAVMAFSGVWIATAPAVSEEPLRIAAPLTPTPPRKSSPSFVVEAPPQDTQPVSAFAQEAPARANRAAASSSVYYPNCNAARAAGAAPIYSGEPGYRPEMDGDGDGIACEPPRNRRY